MFSKEKKKEVQDLANSSNHIDKGTKITGNIEVKGNIRIDGEIEGNINSSAKVVLGVSCLMNGNIVAVTAEIEGQVNGILEVSENLILKETATINGDITVGKLQVVPGAVINGKINMGAVVKNMQKSGEKQQQYNHQQTPIAAGKTA